MTVERILKITNGLDFPQNEIELALFNEAHKDFKHELDGSEIDPNKILERMKIGNINIQGGNVQFSTGTIVNNYSSEITEKKFGSKTRFLLLRPQLIKSKLKSISFDLNHQFGSVKFSISKDIALKMKKKQDKSIILTDVDGSKLSVSHNGNDTHININDKEDERTIVIDCNEYNSIIEFLYSSFK